MAALTGSLLCFSRCSGLKLYSNIKTYTATATYAIRQIQSLTVSKICSAENQGDRKEQFLKKVRIRVSSRVSIKKPVALPTEGKVSAVESRPMLETIPAQKKEKRWKEQPVPMQTVCYGNTKESSRSIWTVEIARPNRRRDTADVTCLSGRNRFSVSVLVVWCSSTIYAFFTEDLCRRILVKTVKWAVS